MKAMKRCGGIFVLAAILAAALASCASTGSAGAGGDLLEVPGFFNLEVIAVANNRSSLIKDGMIYSPKDNSDAFYLVNTKIENTASKNLSADAFLNIETVSINNEGKIIVTPFKPMAEDMVKLYTNPLKGGEQRKQGLYFIHEKGYKTAALVYNREQYVLLLPEKDPNYGKVREELNKFPEVKNLLVMAVTEDFDEVNSQRLNKGIDIDADNIQGLTLLYAGIMSKNDSVVEGAIQNGANVRKIAVIGDNIIEPIHAAAVNNNLYAINALLDAGADINADTGGYSGVNPIIFAIEQGSLEGVKTLVSLGADVTKARRKNGLGSISALHYARNLKQTEIAEYLQSLEQDS